MLSLFRALSRCPLWLLHALGALLGWITYVASPTYRRRFHPCAASSMSRPAHPELPAHRPSMMNILPWRVRAFVSNHAPLAPSSESTRPQYGSRPYSEHCTSWLPATERAARRASSDERAPRTTTVASFVAPSASAAMAWARSSHTSVTASTSAATRGG